MAVKPLYGNPVYRYPKPNAARISSPAVPSSSVYPSPMLAQCRTIVCVYSISAGVIPAPGASTLAAIARRARSSPLQRTGLVVVVHGYSPGLATAVRTTGSVTICSAFFRAV